MTSKNKMQQIIEDCYRQDTLLTSIGVSPDIPTQSAKRKSTVKIFGVKNMVLKTPIPDHHTMKVYR
jgi:hypothetical protein